MSYHEQQPDKMDQAIMTVQMPDVSRRIGHLVLGIPLINKINFESKEKKEIIERRIGRGIIIASALVSTHLFAPTGGLVGLVMIADMHNPFKKKT
jgi:hypothetical protein